MTRNEPLTTEEPQGNNGLIATWIFLAALVLAVGGVSLPQPWRFLLGGTAIMLLPGLPIAFALHGLSRLHWVELVPLGFGYTLALVAPLNIIGMEAHLDIQVVFYAVATLTVTGWTLSFMFAKRQWAVRATLPECAWALAVVAGLIVVGAFIFKVGGCVTFVTGDPRGEEAMHLGMLRQPAESSSWSVDGIFYTPGTIYTTMFIPYHTLLALVSHFTATDPLLVYVYIRPLMMLVALMSMGGIIYHLTRSAIAIPIAILT